MKRPLPQTGLKLIACFTMLLDHLAYAFVPSGHVLYIVLRTIGRLAFPLYCFLITEGVSHTKSPWKYLLRLGLLAILAEPCFDLMCFGRLSLTKQSVMVTLILGAGMCIVMQKLPRYWMKPFVVIPFYLVMPWFKADYGANGILMIALFMLTRELPLKELWQVLLLGLLSLRMGGFGVPVLGVSVPVQWFAVLAMVPILLYSGQKGRAYKGLVWAMNLFYPAHLAIIVAIKLFFF